MVRGCCVGHSLPSVRVVGIRHWVPRQGIRGIVLNTLHPLRGEVVGHGAAFESLEMWIINFIESVVVEDRYKGMVVSDDYDMWEA